MLVFWTVMCILSHAGSYTPPDAGTGHAGRLPSLLSVDFRLALRRYCSRQFHEFISQLGGCAAIFYHFHPHQTMSYFKFGAKDLDASGYDSSDSAKNAAMAGGRPNRTITPCKRPKAMGLDQFARPDPAILELLREEVTVGSRTTSVIEAARPGMGAARDKQPPFDLAVHIHNALARSGLTVRQKARLYGCLEWRFECMSCGGVRRPDEFDTTLYLWGEGGESGTVMPHVRLRGGPCKACVADARAKGHSTDILLVDVNLPEACKITKY